MGKHRTLQRARRSFIGNQHVKVQETCNAGKRRRGRPKKVKRLEQRSTEARPHRSTSMPLPDGPLESSPIPVTGKSASFRKLFEGKESSFDIAAEGDTENATGYRFIDLEVLCEAFQALACPECMNTSLCLSDNLAKKNGCANFLLISCSSCGWSHDFYTSKQSKGAFDVNKRIVYGMRIIGNGFSGLKKFAAIMNMPSVHTKNNYSKVNKSLKSALCNAARKSMEKAAKDVKSMLPEGSVDCGVSVDGCWQRRGYQSLNGCVAAISIDTGKVLDVEPMSRNCKECQFFHKIDHTSERFLEWKESHINCKANFKGSAPAMEPEGAIRIFKRSFEMHGLYYTKFFGDGDSKSYSSVKDIYSDVGIDIAKYECIGHVQKRMGTALRKLKKEKKGLGGKGRLTDRIIDKIQNYYGIAIRQNVGNIEEMKKAILAVLFHCASSKEKPYHTYCPDGETSWCSYKADRIKSTNRYKPGPGLPLDIISELKPLFARLSNEELLKKCLHGRTQNQNESFHGVLWDRVPKATYVGKDIFEIGVFDAVVHFNEGYSAILEVFREIGLSPGFFTQKWCKQMDISRLQAAEYKEKDGSKLARKKLRSKRKSRDETVKESEGDSYGAGEF